MGGTMKKTILVFAAAACMSMFAAAQSTAGSTNSTATPSNNPTVTVDGCLSGSGGSYMLKDKSSGTTYALAGDTSKLAKHVGHEVKITGTASSSGASSSSAANAASSGDTSSMAGQSTLTIASMKHVAATCSAGQ
jgi:hypothetical protein